MSSAVNTHGWLQQGSKTHGATQPFTAFFTSSPLQLPLGLTLLDLIPLRLSTFPYTKSGTGYKRIDFTETLLCFISNHMISSICHTQQPWDSFISCISVAGWTLLSQYCKYLNVINLVVDFGFILPRTKHVTFVAWASSLWTKNNLKVAVSPMPSS